MQSSLIPVTFTFRKVSELIKYYFHCEIIKQHIGDIIELRKFYLNHEGYLYDDMKNNMFYKKEYIDIYNVIVKGDYLSYIDLNYFNDNFTINITRNVINLIKDEIECFINKEWAWKIINDCNMLPYDVFYNKTLLEIIVNSQNDNLLLNLLRKHPNYLFCMDQSKWKLKTDPFNKTIFDYNKSFKELYNLVKYLYIDNGNVIALRCLKDYKDNVYMNKFNIIIGMFSELDSYSYKIVRDTLYYKVIQNLFDKMDIDQQIRLLKTINNK
jgi:hypothetical protein